MDPYLATFTAFLSTASDEAPEVVPLQPFSGAFALTGLRDANTTRDLPELLPFFLANLSEQLASNRWPDRQVGNLVATYFTPITARSAPN